MSRLRHAPQGGASPPPLPARASGAKLGSRSRIIAVVASMPTLLRAGFALLVIGGLGDIGYHLLHGVHPHQHGQGFDLPLVIHLMVALGMVLSLLGLFREGFRSRRRHRPAQGGR